MSDSNLSSPSSANKKHSYASILDYLESKDPFMRELIDLLQLESLFKSRSRVGVVFLNPVNTDWRAKAKSYIDTENTSELSDLAESLGACILHDNLKTISEFKQKHDDIPNSLGNILEIDLDASRGNTLKLKNSQTTIVLDPDFVDGSKLKNISVYRLVGDLPTIKSPPSQYKYLKSSSKKKKNQQEDEKNNLEMEMRNDCSLRYEIIREIESEYANYLKNNNKSVISPYIDALLSIYSYIKTTDENNIQEYIFNRILPIVSFSMLDIYLILEPFKTTKYYEQRLLPAFLIKEWDEWRKTHNFDAKRALDNLLDDLKTYNNGVEILMLLDLIDDKRTKILKLDLTNKIINSVYDLYNTLTAKNEISSAGNNKRLFNKYWHMIYSQHAYRKLAEDELRYYVFTRVRQLEDNLDYDRISYQKLLRDIQYVLSQDEPKKEKLLMLNDKLLSSGISSKAFVNDVKLFIKSVFFMFMPLSLIDSEQLPFEMTATKPSIKDEYVYNPLFMMITYLKTQLNTTMKKNFDHKQITEILNMIIANPDNLDPEIKQIIEKIKNK